MLFPSGQIFFGIIFLMEIQLQALPNLTSLFCQGTSRENQVYAVSKWTHLFGIIFQMEIQLQAVPNLTSLLCPGTSRKSQVYAVSKWTALFGIISQWKFNYKLSPI